MKPLKVKYTLPAIEVDMGGMPIKQPLPTMNVEQVDPFLLLHHAAIKLPKHRKAIHAGVGPHPHRGFSPVTFVIDGEVHHRDSRGNSQVASEGDVQWMHAGAGIVHSERPSEKAMEHGRQEIIQLWVNTPAANKMNQPDYQYLAKDKMNSFSSVNDLVTTRLIAGNYEGQKSEIRTQSELLILWANAEKDFDALEHVEYQIPANYNCAVYLINGALRISEHGLLEEENLCVFESLSEESVLKMDVTENTQFLILSGKPIDEKVVSQGPFVMNNETQIMEAMRDYQMGKMGILIEE